MSWNVPWDKFETKIWSNRTLQFSSYSGFRRHQIKIHAHTENTDVPHEISITSIPDSNNSQLPSNSTQCLNDSETPSTSAQCQNDVERSTTSTQKQDMCASIVAEVLASGVPNTVVLSMTEHLEEFVGDLQSSIEDQVLSLLPTDNPSR